jgi:hypothetical protein
MLPTSWTRVPITGRFVGRDGAPVAGRLVFDSEQHVEVDGVLVVPRRHVFVLDEDGNIPDGATLPSTNDPSLNVTGWTYRVHEEWPRGRKVYQIFIPHDAVSVNIPEASPVVSPAPSGEERGPRGYSAYEVAVQAGFEGTAEEWLASIQGEDGEQGPTGASGVPEYGVFVTAASGETIALTGYSSARSIPQARTFTRVFVETDADITLRILFNGTNVFEDQFLTGVSQVQVEPLNADAGASIVFEIVAGDATSVWAQIDNGDVDNILLSEEGEPVTTEEDGNINL